MGDEKDGIIDAAADTICGAGHDDSVPVFSVPENSWTLLTCLSNAFCLLKIQMQSKQAPRQEKVKSKNMIPRVSQQLLVTKQTTSKTLVQTEQSTLVHLAKSVSFTGILTSTWE
jgi:hypothetical protein